MHLLLILAALVCGQSAEPDAPGASLRSGTQLLKVVDREGALELEVYDHGVLCLRSETAGVFRVGAQIENGWPRHWDHGTIESVQRKGPWLVLEGEVKTEHGVWQIQDSLRPSPNGFYSVRRWIWQGAQRSPPSVLAIHWLAPGHGKGVLLPGILYYGNPAGAASRAQGWQGLVPVWKGEDGERLYFQEHRFPAPFASFEWPSGTPPEHRQGTTLRPQEFGLGAALHLKPSRLPHSPTADAWWSLGVEHHAAGTLLAGLSGPVVLNGQSGVVKSGQQQTSRWDRGWIQAPPGAVIEKESFLQAYEVPVQGFGFRTALAAALKIHAPFSSAGLPRVADIVGDKVRFARSRWRPQYAPRSGFAMYPSNPSLYVMGWAGQSDAPGYALLQLAERLQDDQARAMARACLDLLCQAPFNEKGFLLAVDGESGEWSRQDPISQGQAMDTFAAAIAVARKQGLQVPQWEAFLQRACDVHAERLLDPQWHPRSTNEAFLIRPLFRASQLFDQALWARAALRATDHYGARHLSMQEPYWGGTLDARCEDKEGAWAGFQAFLAAYDATGEDRYLDWAGHACDVALSYTVLWDIDLPPGRLRDHALKTRGWTSVSVQNMHLDVYGVVYAPEVYRLGQLTQRQDLQDLALVLFRSAGQMIDADGSQGEQLQQTRFAQAGDLSDPDRFRGGYVEGWTVFWITAHFLTAAAKFDELGVLEQIWSQD